MEFLSPQFLIPLFFLTALVYSMAGFGGGSTYLALLAFFSFPYALMPKIALLCNLTVVTGGTWFFYKEGYLSWRRILPFIISSIPMAYWGGSVVVGKRLFTLLLAISLIVAALRLFLSDRAFEAKMPLEWKKSWIVGLPLGAVLGFLSGLVGIGGGIYFAPVLLLLGWADAKQAAASASLFILVNSVAGLAGQFAKGEGFISVEGIVPLVVAVFLGGQIGSRIGARSVPKLVLQRMTAVLILFVSGRLLWGFLGL